MRPILASGRRAAFDIVNNPFNAASAHHRPIGTGAIYAVTDDPVNISWRLETFTALNVGDPYGHPVFVSSPSDQIRSVTWSGGLTGLNLPWNNHYIPVMDVGVVGTDSNVILYSHEDGLCHEFYGWLWNGGNPSASARRSWDPRGAGHGTSRTGFSASGVAGLFGLARGFELDLNAPPIGHVFQLACRAKGTPMKLDNRFIWPAVSTDGFCSDAANCTGNIPYGALFALHPSIDLNSLGLTALGRRLAETCRDYGIYVVDNAAGCAIRADQYVSQAQRTEFKTEMQKFYMLMRWISNNAANQLSSGGGTPIAPNTAYDAQN